MKNLNYKSQPTNQPSPPTTANNKNNSNIEVHTHTLSHTHTQYIQQQKRYNKLWKN